MLWCSPQRRETCQGPRDCVPNSFDQHPTEEHHHLITFFPLPSRLHPVQQRAFPSIACIVILRLSFEEYRLLQLRLSALDRSFVDLGSIVHSKLPTRSHNTRLLFLYLRGQKGSFRYVLRQSSPATSVCGHNTSCSCRPSGRLGCVFRCSVAERPVMIALSPSSPTSSRASYANAPN
jgi:hypothetical protein